MRLKALVFLALLLTESESALAYTLPNHATVKSYECLTCANLSHEKLSLAWPIEDSLLGHETLHEQSSRKYQIEVNLKQLQKGVAIYTESPGALIHISSTKLHQNLRQEFHIRSAKGVKKSLKDASSLFSKEEGLKETAFADDTLAVSKLKKELGSGKFILTSPANAYKQAEENDRFIIQIYDSNSSSELNISTDKASYDYGEELKATIRLRSKNNLDYAIDSIAVNLIDPAGNKIYLDTKPLDKNTYQTNYKLLLEKNAKGENWHIEAKVSGSVGKRTINRHTHTAFSYIIPSAAVREVSKSATGSLDFSARVEVAIDSRYALQAVLYGSDIAGQLHPIQTVQTASWLTLGLNNVKFSFDSNLRSDYKAPYYIGYIHLTDFGQLKPVFEYDKPIEISKLG
ncbi:MAG: DUF4785 family protein [Tatlockia sp.]|nr:DUF4785 family protein [Tatlockia sp.]